MGENGTLFKDREPQKKNIPYLAARTCIRHIGEYPRGLQPLSPTAPALPLWKTLQRFDHTNLLQSPTRTWRMFTFTGIFLCPKTDWKSNEMRNPGILFWKRYEDIVKCISWICVPWKSTTMMLFALPIFLQQNIINLHLRVYYTTNS